MDAREQGRVGFGRGYGGPGKYIQRANEIERLPDHVKPLGDKAFLLVDGFVLDSMGGALRASFEKQRPRSHGGALQRRVLLGGDRARRGSRAQALGGGCDRNRRRKDRGHRQGRGMRDRRPDRDRSDHRLDRRALQRDCSALYAERGLPGVDVPAAQSRHRAGRQRRDREGAASLPRRRNGRRAFDMVRGALQRRDQFVETLSAPASQRPPRASRSRERATTSSCATRSPPNTPPNAVR